MSARIILGSIVTLVLVLGGAWLYRNFERVPTKEWVGMRGEALTNRLLAAERLLARMGATTRTAKSLSELDALSAPHPGSVLILGAQREALGERHRTRIIEWVESGGTVIVGAESLAREDPLFDGLGIDRDASDETPDKSQSKKGQPTEVRLPGSMPAARPLNVLFDKRISLSLDDEKPELEFKSGETIAGLALRRGGGRVIAFNDFHFFENDSIGRHDHAEFLWQLVRWSGEPKEVLFFHHPERLSLWKWLVDHALAALISCAAFLMLWLWRIAIRFGPIAPDPLPVERRLADHLVASGRFEWANGGGVSLLAAARALTARTLAHTHPEARELAEGDARTPDAFRRSVQAFQQRMSESNPSAIKGR